MVALREVGLVKEEDEESDWALESALSTIGKYINRKKSLIWIFLGLFLEHSKLKF